MGQPYPGTPLGPGTRYPWDPAPPAQEPAAVQVPASQNIDPNANINPNTGGMQGSGPYGPTTTPTIQAQAGAQQAAQNPPTLGAPAAANGMFTPDQTTAQAAQEVQQANLAVAASWDQIKQAQDDLSKVNSVVDPTGYQAATQKLDTLYNNLSVAENRVQTANVSYASALHNAVVDPSQVNLQTASANKAQSDGDYAAAQAKVLTDGAPSQRALAAAQASNYSASAVAQQATADATVAKTPAEVQQLQAQAAQYNAQAAQTNALIPGLLQKQQADITLTDKQSGLTDAQSDYWRANAAKTTADAGYVQAQTDYQRQVTGGLLPAQIGTTQAQGQLYGAQGTNQLASAASSLAGIQQNQLGPLYGLQDKVNAIRAIQQQVFGPGGSGDPSEANDLLNQFTSATIAGTTPYAANVAAANAGLTAFGTQASMFNAAQQALASRANALAGLGGNVLNTLGTMNANAPAGSTAMAGAFKDVIDYMANKAAAAGQGTPGGVQAVAQPTAPALPPLLARLAGQSPAGMPNVTGGIAPAAAPPSGASPGAPAAAPLPMPNPIPNMTTPANANPAPQTSAPVTINIGGQGQQQPAQPSPPPGGYAPPAQQPGTYGALSGSMPSSLQNYAPPTPDFVHQLWGNELQSGAVKSPYDTMNQQIQGPSPAPVM